MFWETLTKSLVLSVVCVLDISVLKFASTQQGKRKLWFSTRTELWSASIRRTCPGWRALLKGNYAKTCHLCQKEIILVNFRQVRGSGWFSAKGEAAASLERLPLHWQHPLGSSRARNLRPGQGRSGRLPASAGSESGSQCSRTIL